MEEKRKAAMFDIADAFERTNGFLAIRQGLIMMIPLIVLGGGVPYGQESSHKGLPGDPAAALGRQGGGDP